MNVPLDERYAGDAPDAAIGNVTTAPQRHIDERAFSVVLRFCLCLRACWSGN